MQISSIAIRTEDHNSEVLRLLTNGEDDVRSKRVIDQTLIDDVDEFHFYLIELCCCFVLTMITAIWYRRRQYYQRGMHKKIETNAP